MSGRGALLSCSVLLGSVLGSRLVLAFVDSAALSVSSFPILRSKSAAPTVGEEEGDGKQRAVAYFGAMAKQIWQQQEKEIKFDFGSRQDGQVDKLQVAATDALDAHLVGWCRCYMNSGGSHGSPSIHCCHIIGWLIARLPPPTHVSMPPPPPPRTRSAIHRHRPARTSDYAQ